MKRKLFASLFLALVVLMGLNGCVVGDCYDCGPCGFVGGPNVGDALRFSRFGVDAGNVPTIAIVTWEDGGCGGEPSTVMWVQFDMGNIVASLPPADEALDTSKGVKMGDTYSWPGKTVTATTEQLTELSMRIAYTDNAVTKSMVCTSKGAIADCVAEVP